MRLRFFVFVAIFSFNCALAQQKGLISAPSPNLPAHPQGYPAFTFQRSVIQEYSVRHNWYWELHDGLQLPQETYKYLPRGMRPKDPDFAPATLEWTFSGKRKLMPSLDLTIIKIRPGQRTVYQRPGAEFGSARPDRSHLWTKATRSLGDALHH
jgi:hypothetical protein